MIQPGEEAVDVFYLLDIANNAARAGEPAGAVRVRHAGRRAGHRDHGRVVAAGERHGHARHGAGTVPAGPHLRAGRLRRCRPTADRSTSRRRLPANLEQLAVVVKKVGDTTLSSPQLKEQREMPADGEVFIAGDRRRGRRRASRFS